MEPVRRFLRLDFSNEHKGGLQSFKSSGEVDRVLLHLLKHCASYLFSKDNKVTDTGSHEKASTGLPSHRANHNESSSGMAEDSFDTIIGQFELVFQESDSAVRTALSASNPNPLHKHPHRFSEGFLDTKDSEYATNIRNGCRSLGIELPQHLHEKLVDKHGKQANHTRHQYSSLSLEIQSGSTFDDDLKDLIGSQQTKRKHICRIKVEGMESRDDLKGIGLQFSEADENILVFIGLWLSLGLLMFRDDLHYSKTVQVQ